MVCVVCVYTFTWQYPGNHISDYWVLPFGSLWHDAHGILLLFVMVFTFFPFSVFSVVFIFSSVFLPRELHVYFQYWHSIGVFSYNESPVLVQEQSSPLVVCFSVAVCIPFGCELFVCLFVF